MNKAKAGDKIIVRKGVYKEAVRSSAARPSATCGSSATAKNPRRVVLEGSGKKQNGFFVNGADQVTIDGFTARNYKANGFFVANAVGYKLTHLVAAKSGVYGVYAFNSKGGEMSHSEAYYHSDAGFYIGQTPQQTKPIRSVVRDVEQLGQPDRLLGHEHALRDDHRAAASTTTPSGSSRTRWSPRSSRPPRRT